AARRHSATRLVAVMADPVFEAEDSRVALASPLNSARKRPEKPKDLQRSASESGVLRFDRLFSTRAEAEEILAFAGGGENLRAVDFEASRANAMRPDLALYRIVHFATHSLLNSRHPERSGIVLSLVDAKGEPQNGFLRLIDVYHLRLGSDLVVLSACQTALGKEVRGEGLVGLTRGFMYAGAPRVLASLWRVPDRATSELMKHFYRAMLIEGVGPATALRAAQMAVRREKRWSFPYYWAAFTLQGDWN